MLVESDVSQQDVDVIRSNPEPALSIFVFSPLLTKLDRCVGGKVSRGFFQANSTFACAGDDREHPHTRPRDGLSRPFVILVLMRWKRTFRTFGNPPVG